ncbi:hypothetical protein L1987_03825 [Smallanthus sonchifolius]|uniref:Uncharacterized protein n=1 Tax=Smallanthus sonchifolius TaxID=185202 RepID=A0ACB9KBN9_9ASTR|nr:hypothetical protein L1987_03825 [Smallanthus sonchifolius]
MASLSKADSRRMYSWWWNSHISPKNSKWLQENLTDVDIKVKAMIKLIEEDADSFARRAEMYYKKRPELMKLVEELYRAYRALAERYDHATGALRQAHKTMTEAFPNQVPAGCDDSAPDSPYDTDPQTPDSRATTISCFDPDDLQKDGPTGTARKALNFSDSEDVNNNKNGTHDRNLSRFRSVGGNDKEILLLKEALAKLEDEKEAGLKQYIESLDKLSKLESEILKSQEESKELADRASNAEAESQKLKDMLQKLEAEKEESLDLYHQAQKKIEEINEQNLKEEISRLKDERDAAYDQYKQSLNMISDLEKKLLEAEKEIETLKLAIAKLTEEKEAQTILYQKCMETIASLELRLVCAQEETERLQTEIDNGVLLLKGAEEQRLMLEKSNKSLHMELESMGVKLENQNQEITEKQKELGRLWTCIQEERIRFVEAETAFHTLQQLHTQSQEELRSMAGELQNRAQILREIEARNEVLEGEIQKQIEENKNLNVLNLSSGISLKEMQAEISSLKEVNGKLEEEVDLRVDQRNALQQEIYCLKEELNELNKKHGSILEQVTSIGLNPESFGSSVKVLQDENLNLKKEWEIEKAAKVALLEKLEIMGQLLERNVVFENSLSDLGAELEDSCQLLADEKSALISEKGTLVSQMEVTERTLKDLEMKYTDLHEKTKVPESDNEDAKGGESVTMERDAFVELQDLQSKVKVIEMAVVEMQMRSVQQKLDSDAKLETAMKQIEELSSQKNPRRSNGQPKSRSEISEADPKDIMLDEASECSSYGVSKRGTIDCEIWEIVNDSKTMFKHNPTASDASLDNIVDKIEASRKFNGSRDDESTRKVLERLNSDVLRLTNLQITIEDLKRKVEITLQSRRGKAMIECETLKGQLMEAETAIQKLYELNGKFVKQLEGIDEGGESESIRRKKVSEQARRVSEKIGRLQLEIQKIQFVLLKLDDETEAAGKTRFLDSSKRVLLKDYLYGGGENESDG